VIAQDPALVEELSWWANCLGLTGSPFDSFQALRGLRTLSVRYQQHQHNATAIASLLNASEFVDKVYFPGVVEHPGHEVAASQQLGFGAMVSFELGVDAAAVPVFLEALQLFTLAESLGGVESLVAHPASMTHAAMSQQDQDAAGITANLLRLSVGIEHVDDLLADLQHGFAAVCHHRQIAQVRGVA
jgi:cystathionine gamma-synthase